jgi:hypothetical protein
MTYKKTRYKRVLQSLKITLKQGKIVGELLRVIGKKPMRSVSDVISEMKGRYKSDYIRRGGDWPIELSKQQKRIDTEHSCVVEFCKAFDLISYQDKYVMLTFFGGKLLKTMDEYCIDNIFDGVLVDFLGKIMLYVDEKKWGIVRSIAADPNGITSTALLSVLNKAGVGLDVSSLEERLKKIQRDDLRKKWKAEFGNRPVDWAWMERKLKNQMKPRIDERLSQNVESLLRLFRHVELVVKNGDKWYADNNRLNCLGALHYWREESSVSYDEFFSSLFQSYEIWSSKLGTQDVPIALVRHDSCLKLDIPWDYFDKIIEHAPLEHNGIAISFSAARFPKKWGIVKNSRNLYYLSIQAKQGE